MLGKPMQPKNMPPGKLHKRSIGSSSFSSFSDTSKSGFEVYVVLFDDMILITRKKKGLSKKVNKINLMCGRGARRKGMIDKIAKVSKTLF